jgi:hypothetical protein
VVGRPVGALFVGILGLAPALAASPGPSDRPVGLYGAVDLGGSGRGPLVGLSGALGWRAHRRVGLVFSVHEVVTPAPDRAVGALVVAARVPLRPWLSADLGFAHAHEVPLADAKARPIATALGTLPGMTHRSGLGGGLRGEWRTARWDRWGGFVGVHALLFPDAHPAPVYVAGQLGIAVDVGRVRERRIDEEDEASLPEGPS